MPKKHKEINSCVNSWGYPYNEINNGYGSQYEISVTPTSVTPTPVTPTSVTPTSVTPVSNTPETPIAPTLPVPETPVPIPDSASIKFSLEDMVVISKAINEAMSKPETAAILKGMDEYKLTAWMAKVIGQPVVVPVKDDGKTEFAPVDTTPATPEDIADFEDEFF